MAAKIDLFDLSRRPIEDFCCQSSECPDCGRRGAGNLSFRDCGGAQMQIRMIYCRTCRTIFSERKGTPLAGGSLTPEKALSVLEHLREGCGTRGTARLVGLHRDTVTRWARLAGDHAKNLHGELVASSPSHLRDPAR